MQTKREKERTKADHSGSSFDSFLEEEGIRKEVEAVAIKRVLAQQLQQGRRPATVKAKRARTCR
jgi:antitoxin HicB